MFPITPDRYWRGFVAVLMLVSTLNTAISAHAQSSCKDPFEGESQLRFSTAYWSKTDFCKHSVPFREILSGGVAPDGIPPIDQPQFETVKAAATWLQPQSPVIAVDINGDARAYPLAILIWHEIANDVAGTVPIAVTFCPLCNSSIVFDWRVQGKTLRFGVSGNLRHSDLIMWDDQTQSWWQQLTGEGIVGVYTGAKLTILASQVVGFGDFARQYPDGKVLSRETGHSRSYGQNPYQGYDASTQPFLFDGQIDKRLPATAHVLAALLGDKAVAYPFTVLASQRVINDTVGGIHVVALWQDGMVSALDKAQIDESRVIGTAALYSRDLDGQTLVFRVDGSGVIRDEQTGSVWNVFGRGTEGKLAGKQLRREIAGPYFWFAWAAFRPDTTVYGLKN